MFFAALRRSNFAERRLDMAANTKAKFNSCGISFVDDVCVSISGFVRFSVFKLVISPIL